MVRDFISAECRHASDVGLRSAGGSSPSQIMGRIPASVAKSSLLRNGPQSRKRYDGAFATIRKATSEVFRLAEVLGTYSHSAGRVTKWCTFFASTVSMVFPLPSLKTRVSLGPATVGETDAINLDATTHVDWAELAHPAAVWCTASRHVAAARP